MAEPKPLKKSDRKVVRLPLISKKLSARILDEAPLSNVEFERLSEQVAKEADRLESQSRLLLRTAEQTLERMKKQSA